MCTDTVCSEVPPRTWLERQWPSYRPFCQPDLPSFLELCDTADEQLFDKIQYNKHHLLHTYFLRRRLPHSPTSSGEDGIASCFRNTLDILCTLTLLGLLEYFY